MEKLSFSYRAELYLFRSPFFRGVKNLVPQRYNEIFSVHHMKIYVFDSNVLLSGANLSDTYFTNRQDRYVFFKDCPELADFCSNLVETLGSLSFVASSNNSIRPKDVSLDPKSLYIHFFVSP